MEMGQKFQGLKHERGRGLALNDWISVPKIRHLRSTMTCMRYCEAILITTHIVTYRSGPVASRQLTATVHRGRFGCGGWITTVYYVGLLCAVPWLPEAGRRKLVGGVALLARSEL